MRRGRHRQEVSDGRSSRPATSSTPRLHGDVELYTSGYSTEAPLDRWAEKCRQWAAPTADVFVYFDNDAKGYAPHDAMALLKRVDPAYSG